MISAQNHRQLLNGNKGWFLFLITLLLVSCGAFLRSTPVVVATEEPVVVSDTVVAPSKPKIEIPISLQKYESVTFKGQEYKVPVHKREFEIAILLPFHVGYKSTQEQKRADLMLEYLQGVNVALKKMEELGSKYRLRIYDTKNDTLVLKRILRLPEMSKMDMIIGPTDQQQVRIAASFANSHKIPVFSPLTIIDKCWSPNSYLFNLKPSDQVMAEEFVKYYRKNHFGKRLVIVNAAGRFNQSFGSALITYLQNHPIIDYKVVEHYREMNWPAHLSMGQNVVLHLTEDKTQLNSAVTSLYAFKDKVTLIGSDKWMDFSGMDYSFLSQLNVHFLSSDLSELGSSQSAEMIEIFRELYHGDPSGFVMAGYDQLLFAAELLDAFGEHFPLFILDKRFEYSNNSFRISSLNNCYHNRSLEVIHFNEFELQRVR